MPGIAGIISRGPADECRRLVSAMLDAMQYEEFYTTGRHEEIELGIYAGWVAHSGSLAANQKFQNEAGDILLLLAGECFLSPSACEELRRKGHRFTEAEGDWLVHLYEELGEGFFGALNGMFSGLLIDRRKREAFLFNDRYGMERLYCSETEIGVFFASEAKALLRVIPGTRSFDSNGLVQLLNYGCTLMGRTLFRGIRHLCGGTLWRIASGGCRPGSYFALEEWEAQSKLDAPAFAERFIETVRRIMPVYCRSSTRLGMALTGGLDTRMVMACLPEPSGHFICYTFAGVDGETLDARVAAEVARMCGMEHHLVRISGDFFENFGCWVDRTIIATDGCFGALGAHEIYLNSHARSLSPLRLTGVLGGEVLRGVSTFKACNFALGLLEPGLRDEVHASPPEMSGSQLSPVTFAAFKEAPWSIFGSLAACRSQVTFRTPFLDNDVVGLAYRCPDTLRNSPQVAVDLIRKCRPGLALIPTDRGYLGNGTILGQGLRRLMSAITFKLDYYNNEGMPDRFVFADPMLQTLNRVVPVIGHHKYLHYRRWFRCELAEYVRMSLDDGTVRRSSIWNAPAVQRMAEEHIRGSHNHVGDLAVVLSLLSIERCLLRN